MNRKGFTAILDAVFFIILIGISTTLLLQALDNDQEDHDTELAEVCDTLCKSRLALSDFGYVLEERTMEVTDIAALSLMFRDGKAMNYFTGYLNMIYPQEGSYGMSLEYNDRIETHGKLSDEWTHCFESEYPVEYGGVLRMKVMTYT